MIFRCCDLVVCNSQAAALRLIDAGLSENKTRERDVVLRRCSILLRLWQRLQELNQVDLVLI